MPSVTARISLCPRSSIVAFGVTQGGDRTRKNEGEQNGSREHDAKRKKPIGGQKQIETGHETHSSERRAVGRGLSPRGVADVHPSWSHTRRLTYIHSTRDWAIIYHKQLAKILFGEFSSPQLRRL